MTLFSIWSLYSVATYLYVNELKTPRLKLTDTHKTYTECMYFLCTNTKVLETIYRRHWWVQNRSYALKCNMYMEAQRLRKPVQNLFPKAECKQCTIKTKRSHITASYGRLTRDALYKSFLMAPIILVITAIRQSVFHTLLVQRYVHNSNSTVNHQRWKGQISAHLNKTLLYA